MFGNKTDNTPMQNDDSGWERELLVKLATASLDEQKRTRRWGIFFKLLGFGYLFFLVFLASGLFSFNETTGLAGKHTAVVKLHGVIAEDEEAGANNVIMGLDAAFKDKNTSAVILDMNTPGGSPVQSGYINDEIKRLRAKYPDIPLYAVISDLCASGGMYIAVAADKIFVNQASLVGSIGVRMDGFGFVDAIDKLGVERRLRTAGEHKGLLDPFLPENPVEQRHVQKLLDDIHAQFIEVVRNGRGDRLKETDDMFSGLIWTGEEAIQLGLADELGGIDYVAREVIGEDNIVDFTYEKDFVDRFAERLGATFSDQLSARILEPRLR